MPGDEDDFQGEEEEVPLVKAGRKGAERATALAEEENDSSSESSGSESWLESIGAAPFTPVNTLPDDS